MTDATSAPDDFDPFAQGELARTAPVTPPQREIWSAIQLGGAPANCAYNEVVAVRFRGALDRAALARALNELAARHEALRTTFSADGSTLLIGAAGELGVAEVDLSGEPDPEAAFRALAAREVSKAFDLGRAPLGRALLARLGGEHAQLLLIFHHIICDGWSFGVLLRDLAALYDAARSGQPARLADAESYATYAEERKREDEQPEARASLAYWLAQFSGALPVLELPTDRARPALRTYAAGRIDHTLDGALVGALRPLAKQHGASLLQLMLTTFQTWLARLTGQWDIVVGLPTAGQVKSGKLGLVGHAVNFLPIRSVLDKDMPFRDAVALTKRVLNDALDHQDVTYGTLLENLPMQRDPSRVPLAPVCFNIDQPLFDAGFSGVEGRIESVPRTFEAFELFANLADRKDSIVIELQYNRDLFDGATIEGWLESYEALLRGVLAAPATPLSKLPVLSEAARTQQLQRWNPSDTPFERDTPIHAFVERAIDASSERPAVVFRDQQITFAELDARANRLAHRLIGRGVGPDRIVGVCVPRSIDTIVAQLAVLKAGGAYLPLDPQNPAERLRFMLDDAGAAIIVTRSDALAALGEAHAERVLMDDAHDASAPSDRPNVDVGGNKLAYVIYTSGSTGKPKGVLVEHQNFANFLVAMRERLGLTPPGVFLCATSTGFDISLLEIFGALAHGFTVVVHGDEQGPEDTIAALLARHGVTHFQCTPSQATIQLASEAGRSAIAGLATMILGGEPVASDLAAQLIRLLGSGRLFNGYGPTETTIYSTMTVLAHAEPPIPIGRPVVNTRAYVLDAQGEPCIRGAIGELYLGGAGVSRGYHQRPELTTERFLPDPFVPDEAARMYRTGDLVRQRSDGVLDYLGRNDHQVKIRGYRIELGEIEVALRAHRAVREAVVIAREDEPGDKRLVAYLLCDEAPTVPELKAHMVALGLPDYMLPQVFVTLAKLPTTASGKVDRRALPRPEGEHALRVGAYVAPRTDTERRLAALWQDVLGMSRVSVLDNFFDLGGHSVSAVRLTQRVAEAFAIELPVSRLFQALTVEQLAAFIDASLLQRAAPAAGDVEIEL